MSNILFRSCSRPSNRANQKTLIFSNLQGAGESLFSPTPLQHTAAPSTHCNRKRSQKSPGKVLYSSRRRSAIELQPTEKLFLPQIHNYYEEKQYNTSKKFIPLLLFMNKPTSTAGIRQRRLPDKSRKSLFPSLENKFTTARESIGTVFFIICTKKTP